MSDIPAWLSKKITPEMMAMDEKRMAEAAAYTKAVEADYLARSVDPKDIGTKTGPVHAASLLAWNRIADHCGVPYIPAEVVVAIPMETAWRCTDGGLSEDEQRLIEKAVEWCSHGRFWRTEICSGEGVKYSLSVDGSFPKPEYLQFSLDDCRIMDMHWGMPDVKVIGRPTMTPVRVNGWPIEFRTFFGGLATDGAVSFYYPQAGEFDVSPEMQRAMDCSAEYGSALYATRQALGLVPWLPPAEPEADIGATIDFMLLESGELVMVDAGPGFGFGAHPCCFIDQEIEGQRWHLADNVELR